MPKNSSFNVIPKRQEELLKNTQNSNFSLYFPRMIYWEFEHSDGKFQLYSGEEKNSKNKWEKTNDDARELLCKAGNNIIKSKSVEDGLKKKQKLQSEYLASLKENKIQTFTITAKTSSPFITGLGSGHPTETGMILDRNLGVPYIPSSSIKGVLRLAYAVNIADGRSEVPDSELEKYFGSTDTNKSKRGQLIFLDAYPRGNVELKVDIMNPHFGKYYDGTNKQPVETESPVPIKFLTIKQGTEFVFNCAYLPLDEKDRSDDKVKDDVEKMFSTAFSKVGFGGKTSIGYGRFERVENQKNGTTVSSSNGSNVQTLVAGEYNAVITDIDKKRSRTITLKVNNQVCIYRDVPQKVLERCKKNEKTKIILSGERYKSNGFYIVTKIIGK